MICKMFTINGKAPTIGNTALTGSAIGNPGVVMSYNYTGNNVPHYDGFSVRVAKTGTTATIDYENMCYYSTAKYDNPDPSQLTKALFIPMSQLVYTTDPDYNFYCLASKVWIPGWPQPIHYPQFHYVFPCDEADYDHAGAYVIPTAEYTNQELYVYVWLPDVLQAPENDEEAGLDCTTLITKGEGLTVNLYKCDMPGLNQYCYNQTYVNKIINCNLPSGHQYFGYGSVIDTATSALDSIELISASNIEQYQPVQKVKSAYDSTLKGGFGKIEYAENCTIAGANNGYTWTTINSAKNCNISATMFTSANGCDITMNDGGAISNIHYSAYNSKINHTVDWSVGTAYFNNCDFIETPRYCNNWTFENCDVSSTRSSPVGAGGIGTNVSAKNTYWHVGTASWYAEDYPTTPFVPL